MSPYFRVVLAVAASWLALGVAPARGAAVASQQARSDRVPAPAEIFGFEPGADYELANHAQIVDYFRRLDAASDRVLVREIGTSVRGRPLILALLSSEENLAQLDRWRSISERLAQARDLSEEEARRLAEEGRAIVWVDAGLHATEVAAAQHAPLLAYRVATEESQEMRRIRSEVVLLLMPVMNPDGLDLVHDWYRRNLRTPYETADLPWLYHAYVGHDNNRDWFMITQPETEAVSRVLYHEWYPQVVYNHHQTAPFPARIFIPPFADPMNPHIPPLVMRGVNLVGDAMAKRFAEEGKRGVVSRLVFSTWWNGGMRTVPYFHNMVGILTETALFEYATPKYYEPDSLPRTFARDRTFSAREPSTFYPDPWRGGWWRLRDAVDYMTTASLAVLDIGADLREDWLTNAYRLGRDAIEAGDAGGPYAYVIAPDEQWDPGAAVELVNVLRRGGVEVRRSTRPFRAGDARFPEGAYIVYAGQAFRPYVLDLFEPQVHPDLRQYEGGPPVPPYDLAGWTLPIQMGVSVRRVDTPFDAATEPVDRAPPPAGRVAGSARFGWALSHRPNASASAVNRLLAAGDRVWWAAREFEAGGRAHAAGTILVAAGATTRGRVEQLARELGLDFAALRDRPSVPLHELRAPRVGIYRSHVANMDEGWTRWVLERYAFPFDTLHDADVRAGDLAGYDAIVLPDQSVERILNGHAPGTMPPEYVGGLGVEGAAALKRYVESGGHVVALDGASDFAIEQFGLPVRNAVADVPEERFFIPGSLIRLAVDPTHPLAYGMPGEAAAFFVGSRAFRVVEPASAGEQRAPDPPVEIAARYAEEDLLQSGWALGQDRYLAGRPAVARVQLGKGSVVLIGFRTQFRGQPHGTFKLLFNALHAAALGPTAGRAEPPAGAGSR